MTSENRSSASKNASAKMSPAHFYLRMSALFLLVLLVGLAGGIMLGRETAGSSNESDSMSDLDAVTDVLMDNYYYRPTDAEQKDDFADSLEKQAINGMLLSLDDQYTRYLPPAEAEIAADELEGEYGGIGVTLETVDGITSVVRVNPDSPASRQGIRAGDVIERIDNRPSSTIADSFTGQDLRGAVGSSVELSIFRPFDETAINTTVIREAIIVHAVTWEMIEGTSYMRIAIGIFGDRTTEELDQALAAAEEQGATGIVLDLRGNGGGWVTSAQETIGRFLSEDVGPALFEDATPGVGDENELAIINGGAGVNDLPMVVLVDGSTASAAEIVSGSLRDYDRAILVGEQTLGKGSVQRIFDFSDGGSLRVTVAEWFTPSRARIQGEGIRPDLVIQIEGQRGDAPLSAAIETLDAGVSTPTQLASVSATSTPQATPSP